MNKWMVGGLLALVLTGCGLDKTAYNWKRYPVGEKLSVEFPVPPVAQQVQDDFYVRGYALEKGHTEKVPGNAAQAALPPKNMPVVMATEYTLPAKPVEEDPQVGVSWFRKRFGEDERKTTIQVGPDAPIELNGMKGLSFAFQRQSDGVVTNYRIYQAGNRLYALSVAQHKGSENVDVEKHFWESVQITP